MLKSYIISAFRSLKGNRLSTLIKILGLSIGLSCALVIFLYAGYQYAYDRFHKEAEHIYRITGRFTPESDAMPLAPGVLKQFIEEQVPEVRTLVRVRREPRDAFGVRIGDEVVLPGDFFLVDSNFFTFFSFPLLEGNASEVLKNPNSVVISRSAAATYFGEKNPIGQTMYAHGVYPFTVSGIMEDFPDQSHFSAQFVANYELCRNWAAWTFGHWGNFSNHYYLLLEPGTNPMEVSAKINQLVQKYAPEWMHKSEFALQPMLDIHLHSSHLSNNTSTNGDITLLNGLIIVGLIILLLACVNYINLSTAQSSGRRKEAGLRKVLGAKPNQIFWQNMLESFMFVLLSFFIALVISEIVLPFVSHLSGNDLNIKHLLRWPANIIIFAGLTMVAFLAGTYPALIIGRFRPADILKGNQLTASNSAPQRKRLNLRFRQILILIQFSCAIALIIQSLSVSRQMHFLNQKDLGYEASGLIMVYNPNNQQQGSRFLNLKHQLEQYPEIERVSAGTNVPSERLTNLTTIRAMDQDMQIQCGHLSVHYDYLSAIGARLAAGRFFDQTDERSSAEAIIINRSTSNALGWLPEEAIGKRILAAYSDNPPLIIGVIEDIHYTSLHNKVAPLLISARPNEWTYNKIVVQSTAGNQSLALKLTQDAWEADPITFPFNYRIVEEVIENHYSGDKTSMTLLYIFMALAIFISLMGLFGLASFVMHARMREMAIRKVLGASADHILKMMIGEFSILVLLSTLLAWPLAWLSVDRWLENFAYQLPQSVFIFIAAPIMALLLAWITVSYHAFRAARTNPAEALKYE